MTSEAYKDILDPLEKLLRITAWISIVSWVAFIALAVMQASGIVNLTLVSDIPGFIALMTTVPAILWGAFGRKYSKKGLSSVHSG